MYLTFCNNLPRICGKKLRRRMSASCSVFEKDVETRVQVHWSMLAAQPVEIARGTDLSAQNRVVRLLLDKS